MTRICCTRIMLVATGVIVVWLSACVLYSYYVRYEAEQCFRIFRQFRVGSTTTEEATKALRSFNRYEVDGTARTFGSDYPLHAYVFTNSGMHLLGLFHPTFFQVGLTGPNDGVLVEMSASLLQMPFHSVTTVESIPLSQHIQALRDSTSGMVVGLFDPPVRMRVSLKPEASDEIRRLAYDYDLDCFTALRGCQDVYKILPDVKQYH